MPDQSQQPKYVEKRVNYFDGQYLDVDDFVAEQNYHIDRQRRMSQLLCVSGILEGLDVSIEGNKLKISTGAAIDNQGRQILLNGQSTIDLPDDASKNKLLLSFKEQESDHKDGGQNTRFQEVPNIFWESEKTSSSVLLAILTKNGSNFTLNLDERQYSGLRLPTKDKEGKSVTLTSQNGANNYAILSGSLSVTGGLNVDGTLVVTGNSTLTGSLTVNNTVSLKGSENGKGLMVNTDGNVGIGTTSPKSNLEIRKDVARQLGPILTLHNCGAGAGAGAAIDFNGYDVGNNASTARIQSLDDGSYSSHLTFLTKQSGGNNNLLQERLRISSNGNVGIGTMSPGARLHVVSANTTSSEVLRVAHSDTDFISVESGSQTGAGKLQFISWSNGWNINTKGDGKHLYLNRDSEATSNVFIGRAGQELVVRGNGNVEVKGNLRVLEASTFSTAGTVNHNGIVRVPTRNTDSWNIFLSPKIMGFDEGNSNVDNALLYFKIEAVPSGDKQYWTIQANCVYRVSNDQGGRRQWDGEAYYLIVPK